MEKKNKQQTEKHSVRDFMDAADVRGIFLYRKDGYVLTYLRIYPYNLNLKSREERKAETDRLALSFGDDRKDFVYFTLPREIDMDKYKNLLKKKYQDQMDLGKRHIIAAMMEQCAELSTNGENYEHQHFIKIWKKNHNKAAAEDDLKDRIEDFRARYQAAGIQCEVLQEQEIVKLCNLYGNSLQASFENVDESTLYTPIMQLL